MSPIFQPSDETPLVGLTPESARVITPSPPPTPPGVPQWADAFADTIGRTIAGTYRTAVDEAAGSVAELASTIDRTQADAIRAMKAEAARVQKSIDRTYDLLSDAGVSFPLSTGDMLAEMNEESGETLKGRILSTFAPDTLSLIHI